MKGDDIFPSKYIKASDLKGRPHLVTISHCAMETLGNDQKLITYFQGKDKGLVTNKTNFGRIAFITGSDETDDWPGAKIIITPELVDFQGKPTMATRVKPPNGFVPKKPPLQNTENPADPISSGPPKKQTPVQQQIAAEELEHDSGGEEIPF